VRSCYVFRPVAVLAFITLAANLLVAAPNITSISPGSAFTGNSVTITGSGFGSGRTTIHDDLPSSRGSWEIHSAAV
jgi:IPT/TIG domain